MTENSITRAKMNKFKFLYIFTYAPIGIICPLIGQYLDSIGFSGTQIGAVTAIGTAASIPAGLIWGKIYSESNYGKKVIALLCIVAACISIICLNIHTFVLFTILYSVMFFFQGPVMGLCDAMVIEEKIPFSNIRLWGSVGYAFSVFIAGRIGQSFGLNKIFILYTAVFIIAGMIALSIREMEHHKNNLSSGNGNTEGKYFRLMHETKYIKMLLAGFFIIGANVANNTYFGFLYRDGGGSIAGIGMAFFLMTLSEAPFMAIAPKIAEKISAQKLVLLAMIVSVLRYFWFSTGPSSMMLLLFFFIQGFVNGFILVEFIKSLAKSVSDDLVGLAVPTFYSFTMGSTIICNYIGGVLLDVSGSTGVYIFFTLYSLVGLAIYLIFKLYK
ncbi:MAG: MFS transporter [Peptostreptococcaceae bacterium]|nr:MFS transporter [Peptostreptococcaceae bacterium]